MKLKQKPEDFEVEEINDFNIFKEVKPYKLYLLKKESLETFHLLKYLSKANNIPVSELSIAGLKDKHALTKQHLTIPLKYNITTLNEKNFSLEFLGYVEERLKLGSLIGNKFKIIVRDLNKEILTTLNKKVESIKAFGVPNYYDSQRFGSVINNRFIVKYIVKGEYEEAVKLYLTE